MSKVAWYTERTVVSMPLGSLMAMVLVRTIQVNISQVRVSSTVLLLKVVMSCGYNTMVERVTFVSLSARLSARKVIKRLPIKKQVKSASKTVQKQQ